MNSDAQIHLITSGIQVLPRDKPFIEKWGNFPESRKRLFNIFEKVKKPGIILLSGDIHYAEILKTERVLSYPIYEITSSGMTHSCATQFPFGTCRLFLETILQSSYQITDFYEFFNFGTIEINWNGENTFINLQIRNVNGTIVREKSISLKELQINVNKKIDKERDSEVSLWKLYPHEYYLYSFLAILIIFFIIFTKKFIFRKINNYHTNSTYLKKKN